MIERSWFSGKLLHIHITHIFCTFILWTLLPSFWGGDIKKYSNMNASFWFCSTRLEIWMQCQLPGSVSPSAPIFCGFLWLVPKSLCSFIKHGRLLFHNTPAPSGGPASTVPKPAEMEGAGSLRIMKWYLHWFLSPDRGFAFDLQQVVQFLSALTLIMGIAECQSV